MFRYRFQLGNDRVDLWINPPASTYNASIPPPSAGFVTGGSDPASLDYFQLYSSPQAGGVQWLDELRLGRSWAEVVPLAGPLQPARLSFLVGPTNGYTGPPLPPVVVQIETASGMPVPLSGVPVTLRVTRGSVPISGTLTRLSDSHGRVSFEDLTFDAPATSLQLEARAWAPGETWLAALSEPFDIYAPPPFSHLSLVQIETAADGFVLTAGSPQAHESVQLLGTTELSRPLSEWLLVDFGYTDPSGRIRLIAPKSAALPRGFYRLRAGNVDTKLEPASIGLQPESMNVSPGEAATFEVVGIGPQLHYLWLSNGGAIRRSNSTCPDAGTSFQIA
ncbi:MAG: hypothetical protein RMN51_11130 [Verrucomicrobiota bacterium]|nr:hypothetical protein [Limisphaera sp.]MDW8382640.1 hypothetical protein [Verrucomicrobiota bacterium]